MNISCEASPTTVFGWDSVRIVWRRPKWALSNYSHVSRHEVSIGGHNDRRKFGLLKQKNVAATDNVVLLAWQRCQDIWIQRSPAQVNHYWLDLRRAVGREKSVDVGLYV